MLLPIARSVYAHDVALWVAGGDQTAFTSALAMHEADTWTGGHTGGVDESLAVFDEHEWWIARFLARQGHNVIALPTRHVAGLRSPDAAVGGLLVEFKTYTGRNPRQLLCRVPKAWLQADRVVVGVNAPWDSAVVAGVFRAATVSARRRGMRAVMLIGDHFQFEWGDWNTCLTPSTSTTTLPPVAHTAEQLQIFKARCEQFRGAKAPPGYRDGLARCIVDSVQSTGVKYEGGDPEPAPDPAEFKTRTG